MFVTALEECSRDNLEFIKERALRAIAELLRAKPEGEAALLTALVNKLGDPSRKLASKVWAAPALRTLQTPINSLVAWSILATVCSAYSGLQYSSLWCYRKCYVSLIPLRECHAHSAAPTSQNVSVTLWPAAGSVLACGSK